MSVSATEIQESASRESAVDEVVVMENDSITEAYIVEALHTFGLKPRTVETADEAVDFAKKKKARSYILDINMGNDRNQEGLNALTRIKKVDEDIFVAVYSNHPDKLQKARKIGADVCREKSGDHLGDIANIVSQMAPPHLRGLVDRLWDTLGHNSDSSNKGAPPQKPEQDINRRKYQELRVDRDWLKSHFGQYVAIVDGELKEEGADRQKVLEKVRKTYSGKSIFFTEVKEEEEVVRILSPLRFYES